MIGVLPSMMFARTKGLHWEKADSKDLWYLARGIISSLIFGQDLGQMGEATVS